MIRNSSTTDHELQIANKAGRAPAVGRRSDSDAARLDSGQATPRHTKKSVYRCYLPVLAGFAAFRRMEPSRQRLDAQFVPPARRSRTGIRPCYSGLQVRPACAGRQGTATAPSSTTKKAGAYDRARTDDLRFTKPLLYQLSYVGVLQRARAL